MMQPMFDGLHYVKELGSVGVKPNVAEKHAELQAKIMSDLITDQLVTKSDLRLTEQALRSEIAMVRSEAQLTKQELDAKMDKLGSSLLIKLGGIAFVSVAALATLMTLLHN